MRKLALVSAAALALTLGAAGVASAIDGTQTMAVKIQKNNAGTRDDPNSVGYLQTTLGITLNNPAGPSFPTKTATLSFDKNLVFNPSKFPTCRFSVIQSDNAKCPSGSKVGTGSARGVALNGSAQESLVVTAYNGGNNKLYLLVVGTTPLQIREIATGTLGTASGNYGRKLTVQIPPNLQSPSGVPATLTQFIVKVQKTEKGVPYIGLKGCSGGKLKFRGSFDFVDGTNQTVTSTANCRR